MRSCVLAVNNLCQLWCLLLGKDALFTHNTYPQPNEVAENTLETHSLAHLHTQLFTQANVFASSLLKPLFYPFSTAPITITII